MNTQVNSIIAGMRRKGINFVAIDFDWTLVSCHTNQDDWDGTVQDLQVSTVNLCSRHTVKLALE